MEMCIGNELYQSTCFVLNRTPTCNPPLCKPALICLRRDWLQQRFMPHDLEPALSFWCAWPAAAKHVMWHDFDLTHIATSHKSRHFAVTWLKTITRCSQLTGPCYNCAHVRLSARAYANLKGTTGEEASQALSTGT